MRNGMDKGNFILDYEDANFVFSQMCRCNYSYIVGMERDSSCMQDGMS